jgi:hypothetical protein
MTAPIILPLLKAGRFDSSGSGGDDSVMETGPI